MASSRTWNNICTECGRHVDILNGDFELSMNLHKQSHKSLDVVNKDLEHTQGKIENTSTRFNKKYCSDCNNDFEIINNDVVLSFKLHAQKHKSDITDFRLSDHSTTSSGKGRSQTKHKTKEKTLTEPAVSSILEGIFHTMPVGLKAHRGFISEKGCSKVTCNLCEITVEPIFSVTEHLKTKLHEDNTIQVIKNLISSELQYQMEFVSFYGSNLYCNLCSCKIDLCSSNLHETVVNIFTHNAGRSHLRKKSNNNDSSQSDKPLIVLKTLALMDPLVNENQNLIEYKMNPYYRCKVCDKAIAHSDNEKELLYNFRYHLNSPGHKKSTHPDVVSVLNKWNDLNIAGKENHCFVVVKQNIYCTACSCFLDPYLEQLLAHVRGNSSLQVVNQFQPMPVMQSTNLPSSRIDYSSLRQENVQNIGKTGIHYSKPMPGGEQLPFTSTKLSESIKVDDIKAQYKELLKYNSTIKWNSRYFENEDDGYACKLCKIVMKCGNELNQLEINIMSHINGKKHNKKVTKEFNGMLDQVQIYNSVIQTNRKFLAKKNGQVWCTLCECTMPSAEDVDTLIKNVTTHLEGTGHIKKKNVNEESNTSVCSSENVKTDPLLLIKESFDKLPISYIKDIEFISVSPIKGYLSCRLCNSTIQPTYLKEHLEELQHVQEKVRAKGPNILLRSQHGMHHQNALQNMGSLSSLLQNINLKSPWQK